MFLQRLYMHLLGQCFCKQQNRLKEQAVTNRGTSIPQFLLRKEKLFFWGFSKFQQNCGPLRNAFGWRDALPKLSYQFIFTLLPCKTLFLTLVPVQRLLRVGLCL